MNTNPTAKNCGLATTSLVLGIIGLLGGFILIGILLAIPAVICGHVALSRIKKSAGTLTGGGMAVAGLVTGYIAIAFSLLIMPALLIPAVSKATLRAKQTMILSNGKQILLAQFAATTDITSTNGWPASAKFQTSTDVMKHMVGDGMLEVSYNFFAAPGITPAQGADASQFTAENNAWCVVADLSDASPSGTPFVFTRNLRVTNLSELKGTVADQLTDDPPFGRRGAVVICMGGAGYVLQPNMRWSDVLGDAVFTNRVLRP